MVVQRVELEKIRRETMRRRRKIWLITTGIVSVLIIFLVVFQFTDVIMRVPEEAESAPQAGEWAMFQRDQTHTGSAGSDGVLPGGTLKWTFTTGGAIHSSPAVVDGTVYFGSRDSHLYALDAATGELRWSFKAGSWVESSPVVVGGVVYFGCNDGNLYALDAKTGEKLWEFPTIYAVRSTPAVADGVVYFGSDDYYVYAVDAKTGSERWRARTDNMVISSPVITRGIVIVGSVDGICYTFNAKNGRLRLQYDTFASIVSSPAVQDGVAYFADTAGYFYAMNISAKNWLFENKFKFYWNALYIYGLAPKPPRPSGYLWGYSSGWGIRSSSSAAVADNNAYLGAGVSVLSIDLTTHKVIWTFNAEDVILSSPAITDKAVFVGGQDGHIYAIDRATGEKLWDSVTGDKISSSPAVVNGTVYIGSHDGKMYAFD